MAFRVDVWPTRVTWIFGRRVAHIHGRQLANTDVEFEIPQANDLNAQHKYVLTGEWIVIHPIVTYKDGADLTSRLLVHEQGHLDIGMLIARALARELDNTAGHTRHELKHNVTRVRNKHVHHRMRVIQKLYDKETNHGTDSAAQTRWNAEIGAALNQPTLATFRHYPL